MPLATATAPRTAAAASTMPGVTAGGANPSGRDIPAMRRQIPPPVRAPAIPPVTVMSSDSTKNCRKMSRRFAPTARRTPISLTRCRTATSMMLITPTPPTLRVIAPTIPSRILIDRNRFEMFRKLSTVSQIPSASLSSGSNSCRRPRISRTCRIAASCCSLEIG